MYSNNNDGWEEDQHEQESGSPGPSNKKWLAIAGVVVVVLIIILLIVFSSGGGETTDDGLDDGNGTTISETQGGKTDEMTDELTDGETDSADKDSSSANSNVRDLQAEVNEAVEDGMFNVYINTKISLDNGKSAANLLVQNSKNNKRPVIIELYLKDSDELIYRSDVIAAGEKLESAVLDKELSKGVYPCVAYFNVLDPDTEKRLTGLA